MRADMREPPSTEDADHQGFVWDGGQGSDVRRLMVLIHRCREALAAQIRPVFLLHDLTDPQWRVLRVLEAAGPVDVTELSRLTFLLPPSLSRILRDLSARDLIAREVAADDGRRFLHALTPKGYEVIAEVAPYFEPIFQEIEARYPPERIRQLTADLRGLLEALQDRGDLNADAS